MITLRPLFRRLRCLPGENTTPPAPGDENCRRQNHFGDGRRGQGEFEFFHMKKPKRLNLNYRVAPWPRPGDKLFKEDSDWWHNARLDLGGKGWNAYAVGYKEAADSLARRILKNWQGNDILTYPMIFLSGITLNCALTWIFHTRVERSCGGSVRRLDTIEPNENTHHRGFADRL
jgi:hypothetical protein